MDLKKLEKFILSKKGVVKEFPFGEEVAVYKVMGKMFVLIMLQKDPLWINLKCDPNDAIGYREIYECVNPGYHMNKKHWNTVIMDGSMEDSVLKDMITESYDLVAAKLTKVQKEELKLL